MAHEPESLIVTIDTGDGIHYLDWGTDGKRPFVMLHGINRSGHMYDQIAPHFQHDYHVIAMDVRGHGDSDWSPNAAEPASDPSGTQPSASAQNAPSCSSKRAPFGPR